MPHGYEVGYARFAINRRSLGAGEPIRVKAGERVLFHILNGSATEIRSLALSGHTFRVVALDGNPVPTPTKVPVLSIGTAERISAIVEMHHPGVWLMGDTADDERNRGMGVVVESLPVDKAGLETLALFEDRFLLAVPADDPLPERICVTTNDVNARKLALLEEGHCLRDQALAYCARRDDTFFSTQSLMNSKHSLESPTAK
jgi:hypothetical protein